MKKLIALLALALPSFGFADSKISALPSTTTLNAGDIIPVVTNPGTSPANKVITYQNFTAGIPLPSSGIAFGSASNTVTSDTNTLRYTPTGGLIVNNTSYFSSTTVPQMRINNPNYTGSYTAALGFGFNDSIFGYWSQSSTNFLCSDFSHVCATDPISYGTSSTVNANLFEIDTKGHFTAGGFGGSQSTATILGNMLIGTGYPSVTNAPTDGLEVKGNIINDTLTANQGVCTDSNNNLISSGASCGGGTGSGIVSPGTFTWTNTQGISLSTETVDQINFSGNNTTLFSLSNYVNLAYSASAGGSATMTFSKPSTITAGSNSMTIRSAVTDMDGPLTVSGKTDMSTGANNAVNKLDVAGGMSIGYPAGSYPSAGNSLSVDYGVTASTYNGGGLSTCGDSTHALSWSGGTFGCQTIAATGGSSALAVQQNAVNITSPTVAINFLSPPFKVALVNSSTSQVTLDGSSVTLQGTVTAASLGALTAVTADSPLSGSGTSGSHLVFTNPGYISGNQSITLSGDASGSGATAITLTNAANQANIVTLSASSVTVTGNSQINGWTLEKGSMSVLGAGGLGVTYNINAGSMTGAGLTSCSAAGNAVNFNSTTNQFGCATGYLTGVTADSPLSGSGTSGSHLIFTNPGYITGNQSISLTGQASGSGTTSIPVTLNSSVTYVTGTVASGNMAKWATATNQLSSATYNDVVSLFSSCSGTQYLGYDGQCHSAAGSGTVNPSGTIAAGNIAKFTSVAGTSISSAAAVDIVNMFTGCSGTQYLGADGACHTASAGTSSNTIFVTTGAADGSFSSSYTISGIVFDSTSFKVTMPANTSAYVALNTSPSLWTSNGTGAQEWDKPTGAKLIEVLICGGGGSGGGGAGAAAGSVRAGGAGGGGGFCAHQTFLASIMGSSATVTIGAGGASKAGGTSGAGTAGVQGSTSTFDTFLSAPGGAGGYSGTAGAGGGGGGGGTGTPPNATSTTGGVGGTCFIAGTAANTASATCSGAGGATAGTSGAVGPSSYLSGAGGGASTTAGAVSTTAKGGGSVFSAAGGGAGGGVNAASPGTAQNGLDGGNAGGTVTGAGGGGSGGAGNGGNGADGVYTGGQGGAGGASNNASTGYTGGSGGAGGGGGGGGGGGTTTGGASGKGGDGKAWVWTYF